MRFKLVLSALFFLYQMKRTSFGILLAFCIFILFITQGVGAQQNPPTFTQPAIQGSKQTPNIEIIKPSAGPITVERVNGLSIKELWLSIVVIIFGSIIVFVEFLLLRKSAYSGEEIMRVIVLTLIVVSTLFALTARFSANQIAPAMGLFGTIAGYLLGRRPQDSERGPTQ